MNNSEETICHEATMYYLAKRDYELSPSVLYRPILRIDGNQWCALYGENIQDGVAGFGNSPYLAMSDFDKKWNNARLHNNRMIKQIKETKWIR